LAGWSNWDFTLLFFFCNGSNPHIRNFFFFFNYFLLLNMVFFFLKSNKPSIFELPVIFFFFLNCFSLVFACCLFHLFSWSSNWIPRTMPIFSKTARFQMKFNWRWVVRGFESDSINFHSVLSKILKLQDGFVLSPQKN